MAVRAALLATLGIVLLGKWRDGSLALYVNPIYIPLMIASGVVLLVVSAAFFSRLARQARGGRDDGHAGHGSRTGVGLIGLAVLLAALAPARPLGSAALASQGTEVAPPAFAVNLTEDTADWSLLEWSVALGGERRDRLAGRPISVVGFVHRPREAAPSEGFRIARFVVRCCAADGVAVSLPVYHPDGGAFAVDSWVRVDGTLRLADVDGRMVPTIDATTLTEVPRPATPYLSPS